MSLKEPTSVSVLRAIFLCVLAIFSPSRFDAVERADSALLDKQPNATPPQRVTLLRWALFQSFVLVIISAAAGSALSVPACHYLGRSDFWIAVVQVVGAMIFLWATLAVRGWDVQTFSGATLTERVNHGARTSRPCLRLSAVRLAADKGRFRLGMDCLLLTQSGHADLTAECPLPGVKGTWRARHAPASITEANVFFRTNEFVSRNRKSGTSAGKSLMLPWSNSRSHFLPTRCFCLLGEALSGPLKPI